MFFISFYKDSFQQNLSKKAFTKSVFLRFLTGIYQLRFALQHCSFLLGGRRCRLSISHHLQQFPHRSAMMNIMPKPCNTPSSNTVPLGESFFRPIIVSLAPSLSPMPVSTTTWSAPSPHNEGSASSLPVWIDPLDGVKPSLWPTVTPRLSSSPSYKTRLLDLAHQSVSQPRPNLSAGLHLGYRGSKRHYLLLMA